MDKTNAVIVWIMDVHFAIAPALISRFEINRDTFGFQLFMEFVHIFDTNKDHSAGHSIARKGGDMQLDIVTRQSHVARIWLSFVKSISKQPRESQTIAIELLRSGRAAHMQNRNREFEHYINLKKVVDARFRGRPLAFSFRKYR